MTHTAWTELTLNPRDWTSGLHHSLRQLRHSWATQWVGLPSVVLACQNALGLTASTNTLELSCNRLSLHIAELMEQRALANINTEPAYHNRLHTADVLVALTHLIRIQSQLVPTNATTWMATLLTAAVAHDFDHPGGINQCHFEIESHSWSKVQAIVHQALPLSWSHHIRTLILNTDTKVVPINHLLVENTPFLWEINWACILLNEADIMASATKEFGPALSQALSDEWKKSNIPNYHQIASTEGRNAFLQSAKFSSHAANMLSKQNDP
jgi:3'5'-cyclic nucleotide phosphodiesterase